MGCFQEPTGTTSGFLIMNRDMILFKELREGMVRKKLEESTIKERMNRYYSIVAFHLYQMYSEYRARLEEAGADTTVKVPSVEEMRGEINRVGTSLVRIMEISLGSANPVKEKYLLRLFRVLANPGVPLPIRHRPPEIRLVRAVTEPPEIKLDKTGLTHCVQVERELFVRSGETDELGDDAIIPDNLTDVGEACQEPGEILLVMILTAAVVERVERRTMAVVRFRDPVGSSRLSATENLPSMIEDVDARIWRRGDDELWRTAAEQFRLQPRDLVSRTVVGFDRCGFRPS